MSKKANAQEKGREIELVCPECGHEEWKVWENTANCLHCGHAMIEKAAHTPGPWHQGAGNGEGLIFAGEGHRMRLEEGGTTLYPIAEVVTGWNKDEDGANALLISKAPRLLAACEYALEKLDFHPDADTGPLFYAWDELRTAIAEAKGESGYIRYRLCAFLGSVGFLAMSIVTLMF